MQKVDEELALAREIGDDRIAEMNEQWLIEDEERSETLEWRKELTPTEARLVELWDWYFNLCEKG